MNKDQTKQMAAVCKILGEEWRDLVAGREGFLVDRKRAGLLRQKVVWGEMDSMVCYSFSGSLGHCLGTYGLGVLLVFTAARRSLTA